MHMDWFRNVPNVIRSQTTQVADQHKQSLGVSSEFQVDQANTTRKEGSDKVRIQNIPEEDITCSLCGEIFNDPRLLPCLHSFCRRCIEYTINPRSTTLTCHLCRKETPLKIDEVPNFFPNFVVNNLLDVEAVRNSSITPVVCISCSEKQPAISRCLDCMDFLCAACHNAHSRVKVTKDHQIMTLEQLKRSENISSLLHRPVFCRVHTGEKVTYFCITCQQTICRECIVSSHHQHDFTIIDQTIELQKKDIIILKETIEKKLPVLKEKTRNLNEVKRLLESRSESILTEIDAIMPKIIKAIKEKEMQMFQELSEIVREKKNVLDKELQQLNNELKRVESTHSFTEHVLNRGTNPEILSLKSDICKKLDELAKFQYPLLSDVSEKIQCDTNIDAIVSAINNFGRFSIEEKELLKCVVMGDISTVIKGQVVQLTLLIKNQFDIETTCKIDDIECELQTPLGVIIPELREKAKSSFLLSFRTYNVGLHKLTIKLLKKHVSGSPFSIQSINKIANKNDPASDILNKESFHEHSETNNSTLNFNKSDIDEETYFPSLQNNYQNKMINGNPANPAVNPAVLTVPQNSQTNSKAHFIKSEKRATEYNKTENSYAQDNEENRYNYESNKIIITQSSLDDFQIKKKKIGELIHSTGSRGKLNGEFHGLFGVASDHASKRVIATDCHNHRVQVFDEELNFLFTFGKKGSGDGEFLNPTGVGIGPNSEIVVCERLKDKIQVFTKEGVFQRRFILNEMKASTLCVDISGRIIIADYTNCCIFVLDPILERWSRFGQFGQNDGELQYPCYVTTDVKGNIYVSDMNSNKIQKYDSEGIFLNSIGSKGKKEGEFLHPTGIAVDIKSRLIVADRDNHRIQVIQNDSEVHSSFESNGGNDGDLNDIHGICVLSDGSVAAADLKNNKLQIFFLD
ncbi:tripartite motif-containing protein 2 isoform X1 [Hydra vulgaris]|uniref:tripartite motif-containing protein 2 isoform X1 n=1 Tax=Hydra vulgaris TaxID=6087 RepID=UPI001F5FB617|nr:tripartite motif-containing protein 2-like isoform X1 [Hydra vulgaris]XP_047136945.1 tripartite motif-containing protein 2-like isoform X1 [Hydra vulgaris]